jgi:cobalt-zinc-cadmium efflux system outer membrane protein
MDRPARAERAFRQTPATAASAAPLTFFSRGRSAIVVALAALLAAATASAVAAAADLEPEPSAGGGHLTMRDALLRALRDSPRLPDSSLELRAREAESLQAGLLPNPALTTEVEDFGGGGSRDGFNASQTTVSLAQLIELGGKRAARVRVADANADLARWDFESIRMDVLSTVAKAFLTTLAAQDKLALTDELRRIADASVVTVARTVESGAVSPVEEGRAKVLLSQVEIEREQRARDLDLARIALAASWGSSTPAFVDVAGELNDVRKPQALEQLWLDVERNPDLARWTSELEQRAATLSLAEAQAVPDVTVSAGGRYYQDEGTAGVVALFSVPLPVFDRNQGAIQAAQTRLDRAKVEQRVAEVSIRSAVAQAYQQLLASYRQVVELRDRTIPQAQTVFRGAQDAYARGLFRYLEVLDAQRTLFQLRATYVDALLAYHTQITDIARLTGRDPSDSAVPTSGALP